MSLQGKNIVIGVCGSIAAYKIASLIRLLVKENAQVQVIMTPDAQNFITPLTLATLSKNPVLSAYFDSQSGQWHNHVALGLQADLLLVAPASANTLSKMANGICDNLLLATYLSARCPVMFAPAMDLDMWKHPATQRNIEFLQRDGNILIEPTDGELASGLIGQGRLAEPEEIVEKIQQLFNEVLPLKGKKALVSAGPTYEAIDPVRFIGNHSSGKMGYAIANTLSALGADVVLVSGPTALETPKGVTRVDVTSASDMLNACNAYFELADIIVMSAAVADYTPVEVATQKIKKKENSFQIDLTKTTDILATLGQKKSVKQTLVGFALETNNAIENAKSKLSRKNLDFIVLNTMEDEGAGFAHDTNKVTIISKSGHTSTFPLKDKTEVASDLATIIVEHQQSINS
ncbi:bifunctional phosphopantothenoylcysteine decarboxylase/phosphopantothenate--cysteine ligase CoaBC [Sphingobacterium psychroaquaticum]|uniref:Coenzyme A biosynthesis bifunctional protein CoaBC n=1 Tax=Sphingobacterium psychroaquaticum TaxID=561061 RepID=A0A1X7KXT8_9SPHI|nr:bifunctional phosphopantothenoylcysteine decarboxylase/phosphopantothenate--cysteine ligase CoaBC [Sphingobacterium psychroaquaticum]QBQ39657.1 bifunctional phosphopantothenoylcysteine decarboxylase/phosphopantothenate--cysteine ligase CoaBC [Sphingobacterium psychroaquaticum]SMG46033.1 phosphopantothenoylcysteine decarboxylase / phosphopantothenate--cysteine ligase [Sphingobacterium psychroaquaticum]